MPLIFYVFMKCTRVLSYKNKKRVLVIALIILIICISIFAFIFDPLSILSTFSNYYLLATEHLANLFLQLTDNQIRIENHTIFLNNTVLEGFIPEIRYKKLLLVSLILFWGTKTSVKGKSVASILTVLVHLLFNTIYIAVGAYSTFLNHKVYYLLSIPNTIAVLCFFSILFYWYYLHKSNFLHILSYLKLNPQSVEKKAFPVMVLTYMYIILDFFILAYFTFEPWINFLFTSTQRILGLFGYESIVESVYLIGNNGSIFMANYCLGLKTMFLFAAIIYLTGDNNKTRWLYIIGGIIFLNFVNIIRFVLLFIHIQKNNGYTLSIDLHDIYNYITYTIVFILWIIWFELFSTKNNKRKTRSSNIP